MRKHWGVTLVLTGIVLTVLMWLSAAPATNPVQAPAFELPGIDHPEREEKVLQTAPVLQTDNAFEQIRNSYAGPSPFWQAFWKVAAVAYLAAMLALLGWLGWRVAWALLRKEDRHELGEHVTVPDVPEALVADPDAFQVLLRQGEARNAIVACWAQLEDATAAAGVPIESWETSSEYTERVVGAWVEDPAALQRLAALYREARFSEHPLDEDAREEASQALTELLTFLRRTWEVRRAAV